MSIDDLMSRLLSELNDATVADRDVVRLLTTLSNRCRDALGATTATALLVGPDGQLDVKAWSDGEAWSHEGEIHRALFEPPTRQGPGLDSYVSNRPVPVHDLTADRARRRWPTFASAARAAGFHGAGAIPLRVGGRVIGALGLLLEDPAPFDVDAVVIAQALADVAGSAVSRRIPGDPDGATIEQQLDQALQDRVVIEQAKGIISERGSTSTDEAFRRLDHCARISTTRLVDVARAVVDGTLTDLDAVPPLRIELPCSTDAPRIARRAFDAWIAPLGISERVHDDARLIVSELVTNAVTHALSAPTMEATEVGGVVRIEVGDGDPTMVMDGAAAERSGPHGLRIVQRLSDSWGCAAVASGKLVWSEVR